MLNRRGILDLILATLESSSSDGEEEVFSRLFLAADFPGSYCELCPDFEEKLNYYFSGVRITLDYHCLDVI